MFSLPLLNIIRTLVLLSAALFLASCKLQPSPLSETDFVGFSAKHSAAVMRPSPPIAKPITLHEAMARAIKYNLDQQIEIKRTALEAENLKLEQYQMLPKFVAYSGYNRRSNFSGGSSKSLITGATSLASSTSSDRGVLNSNLDLSWSVLDFGLSYYRAKQVADEVMIANEQRRKVINGVIEDVRTAFWRTYAAQALSSKLVALEREAGQAMNDSRALHERQLTSPLAALTYQRELADIQREINNIHGDLQVAKSQLAALINIPPGTKFTLAPRRHNMLSRNLPNDINELSHVALQMRPEMRELAYRERINEQELKTALLQVLPDFSLGLSGHANSNSFLFNGDWVSWAAKASWNLLGVLRYPQQKAQINAQEELIHARARAVALAIVVQVHVSEIRYRHNKKIYSRAKRDLSIQRKILRQVSREAQVGIGNQQSVIREKLNTLVSQMRVHVARAGLENSIANLYASSGLDIVDFELNGDESLEETTRIIRNGWGNRAG